MKKSTILISMSLSLTLLPLTAFNAMAQISPEQAKQIVLKHAGVAPGDADYLQISQDVDNDITEYEIEFWKGNTEYEYTVNAANGQIISQKQEIKQNSMITVGSQQTMPNQQMLIDNQKATEIALNHAGIQANQTRNLNCYQEMEEGKVVYKVKFWKEYTEYDYEIDAATGSVIEFDIEKN